MSNIEDTVTKLVASPAFDFQKAATVFVQDKDRYVYIADEGQGLTAEFGDASAWEDVPEADLVVSMDEDTLEDVLGGNITSIMGLFGKGTINEGKPAYASALIEAIGNARMDLGL